MKKSALLISLVSLMTLMGCGNSTSSLSSSESLDSQDTSTSETTSSSETSEIEQSSSSEITSSSEQTSQEDIDVKKDAKKAIEKLQLANGHPNKIEISSLQGNYYLTSGEEPLSVVAEITGVANRYTYQQKDIVTIDKETKYVDSKSEAIKEHNQKSYDNRYFYDLTLCDDPDIGNTLNKYSFEQEKLESFLGFGLGQTEMDALGVLLALEGTKDFKCEILGANDYKSNGTWNLSFRIIQYEANSKVFKQTITYNDTFDIKNDVIIGGTQEIENAKYAGAKKANWTVSNSTFKISHGDYLAYPGTPYNPNNY